MSDDFEFRIDPLLAQGNIGTPRQVCAVKVDAFKRCADYVRKMSVTGDGAARRLADFLDHVGITPDFDPAPISMGSGGGESFISKHLKMV